jgi:DNA polymerase IV (DinB-like DNA polymerase)
LERVLGHLDLDYFYAQVEEVQNPSIKGRPVVVCVFSGRTEDSGVVSTSNYRARELGVHSGLPIAQAKKRLQDADPVLIKMNHEKYEIISDRIMQVVRERVDALEQTGIDEAFFDVSTSSGGDYQAARRIAEIIKGAILREEGLTCSIGVGRSKAVAKLGSDMSKPGGLMVVLPDSTQSFLNPIPVSKLYGVGPKTESLLGEMRIRTIGELSSANPSDLEGKLGKKLSVYLIAASNGADDDPVREGLEPTQFSRIITLKQDTRNPDEALAQLSAGINYIRDRLASTDKSFKTLGAIGVLTDLSIHTKSRTFDTPMTAASSIEEHALELFVELSKSVNKDFRRVGLRVSGLANNENQKSLSEFIQTR